MTDTKQAREDVAKATLTFIVKAHELSGDAGPVPTLQSLVVNGDPKYRDQFMECMRAAIDAAIEAERERCAGVVEKLPGVKVWGSEDLHPTRAIFADAIRKGTIDTA